MKKCRYNHACIRETKNKAVSKSLRGPFIEQKRHSLNLLRITDALTVSYEEPVATNRVQATRP